MINLSEGVNLQHKLVIQNVDFFIVSLNMDDEFSEFCKKNGKGLLKVNNKTILAYQLEFLDRNNIKKAYIITNKEYKYDINDYLSNRFKGEIKCEILETNKKGIDIFSVIKKKSTKKNFIVLPDDVIFSFDLFSFIDSHINQKNLLTFILKDNADVDDSKLNFLRKKPNEIFGVRKNEKSNLYDVVFHNTYGNEKEEKIVIHKKLLQKEKNFNLLYNFQNIEFYIFNKNIFTILEKASPAITEKIKQMSSISNDFVPFVISKLHSKSLNKLLQENSNENNLIAPKIKIQCKVYSNSNAAYKSNLAQPNKILKEEKVIKISDFPTYISTIEEIQKPYEEISLMFFLTRNNSKNYFKEFEQKIQENMENGKQFNYEIPEISMMSMDTYIGVPFKQIEKDCRINRTVVGAQATVLDRTKITNCLICEGAKIGKDCKITNSIIGENAVIGDNAVITDCLVMSDFNVANGVHASSKTLKEITEEEEDIFNIND